jgi:hypothetical protein
MARIGEVAKAADRWDHRLGVVDPLPSWLFKYQALQMREVSLWYGTLLPLRLQGEGVRFRSARIVLPDEFDVSSWDQKTHIRVSFLDPIGMRQVEFFTDRSAVAGVVVNNGGYRFEACIRRLELNSIEMASGFVRQIRGSAGLCNVSWSVDPNAYERLADIERIATGGRHW